MEANNTLDKYHFCETVGHRTVMNTNFGKEVVCYGGSRRYTVALICNNTAEAVTVHTTKRDAVEHATKMTLRLKIMDAIQRGLRAGTDTWDDPAFAEARELTERAGCVWDFSGWEDALWCLQGHHKLGGVEFDAMEVSRG